MSVSKTTTKDGAVKYLVEFYTKGRGSKRVKKRFDSKADALAFLEEYKLRKREQKKVGCGIRDFEETTFGAEAEYWLKHRTKEFSPGHLKRAQGILKEILPEFQKLTPIRFQPEFLSDFQNRELDKGLKPASVNRKTEVITAILSFSVKHRRIPYNPTSGFQKLKSVREGVSFWERHEAEAFLRFADKKYPKGSAERWIYVVYVIALNTALRAGEIWGLQAQDLVQSGELLYVQRQYDRVKKDFGPLKWRMPPRYVPCNADLHSELLSLINARHLTRSDMIFRDQNGKPICHEVFVKGKFAADLRGSQLRRIRFHDLRHTATTLMIAEGLDVNTVREICGHKNLKTTMDYVHVLGSAVKQASRRFSVGAKTSPNDPEPTPASVKESTKVVGLETRRQAPHLVLVK